MASGVSLTRYNVVNILTELDSGSIQIEEQSHLITIIMLITTVKNSTEPEVTMVQSF